MVKDSEKTSGTTSTNKHLKSQPINKCSKACCLTWLPLAVIKLYRYFISPLLGNQCRFYPTCSQYSEEAYQRFGLLKGTGLTLKRIIKCHPWHTGGIDLVPGNELTKKTLHSTNHNSN